MQKGHSDGRNIASALGTDPHAHLCVLTSPKAVGSVFEADKRMETDPCMGDGDVLLGNVCQLDLSRDPPSPYDQGRPWPQGSLRVMWGTMVGEQGKSFHREWSRLPWGSESSGGRSPCVAQCDGYRSKHCLVVQPGGEYGLFSDGIGRSVTCST